MNKFTKVRYVPTLGWQDKLKMVC